jgi:hypothetical protein
MCDYSLHSVTSRPAKVELVTTRLEVSREASLPLEKPNVAVCLLPGTELAFEKRVERDHDYGRLPGMQVGKLGHQVARFRKVNEGRPNAHHEAGRRFVSDGWTARAA